MPGRSAIHRVLYPPSFSKTCKVCLQEKPRSDFYVQSKYWDGYKPACKTCDNARSARSYRENPDRAKQWRSRRDPDVKRHFWLKGAYGITLEDYNRMSAEQGGVCAICEKPESESHQNGKVKGLSVDHCHKTGKIRGLLCNKCNKAIGLLGHDAETIRRTMKYLDG